MAGQLVDDSKEIRRELKRVGAELRWIARHGRELSWRWRLRLRAAAQYCSKVATGNAPSND